MSTGGEGPRFGEVAQPGPDDVCYRHPGRSSFTLCQRCGRTICSECQTVSSVGVLCPECVAQSRPPASARASRRMRATSRRIAATGTPVVTYSIMAVCVIVFVLQWLSSMIGDNGVTVALWYAPAYSLPDAVSSLIFSDVSFQPWRMVTAMFTHSVGSLLHIAFNMFALWLFGRSLEHLLGRGWFLLLYLYAGIGGSLMVMLWGYVEVGSIAVPTVGASGAIFGVLAATLVAYRAANVNITSLAVLIAINFGIGLLPGMSISWQAHLGGIVIGALTMWMLLATRGPRKVASRRVWSIVIGVALVLLSCAYVVIVPGIPGIH